MLICQQPEGRNERDPKARGDPGCGCRIARNDLPNQRNWEATCSNNLRALLAASVSLWVMTAAAQDESRPDESSKVGEVNFAVFLRLAGRSKSSNRAVAILHSFWYEEAGSAFNDVIKTESLVRDGLLGGCAMSNWHPLWSPPSAEELSVGSKAVAAAAALGGRTETASATTSTPSPPSIATAKTLDHHARAVAYEKAMEKVHLRFIPMTKRGQSSLLCACSERDGLAVRARTYSNQKKAAEILNAIFAGAARTTLGVAHYLIHSYDSAPLARELGLPAAICYSKIAPSVPHALHHAVTYFHA